MRTFRAPYTLLSVCILLGGCAGEPPSMICEATLATGDPTVEASIWSRSGVEWVDGGDVDFVPGGQGGYMVEPMLALPPEAVPAGVDRLCARVDLDNVDPSGGGRFIGFETLSIETEFRRNAINGRFEARVIYDQLRWTTLPPSTPFRLIAVIRTEAFVASVTRDVLLQ